MSLQLPLIALTGNDNNYYLDVTFNGDPFNLTGYTPHVYVKATAAALDNTATIYNIGAGLAWVTQGLGKLKLTIPHTDVTVQATKWWRLDIVDGSGNVSTVFYGPLTIKVV
jgi:hypothetical protein